MTTRMPDLARVESHFPVLGELVDAAPYGTGHINDTYCTRFRVNGGITRYILQRINHKIFARPDQVMENIVRVTAHLRSKIRSTGGDLERGTLTVIHTKDGKPYFHDEDGNWWRMYVFVEGARTYDVVQNAGQAFEAARLFGRFQELLGDFPGPRLHDTIPNFHNTPTRFAQLERAIAKDTVNRAASARNEIEFCLARKSITPMLTDLCAKGKLTERITHNDTKINNVMLDDVSGSGVCVIDLDTVMPGLSLYDFGDCVRATTALAAEDERDLAKVGCSLDLFGALVKGYLSTARSLLSPLEIELLPFAGRLITFEIGIRFLTDYLAGDHYFKTHRSGHNLDRCRTQFRMVERMEAQEKEMAALVAKL